MTILIYVLCFYVYGLVVTILKNCGILLGGIPTLILVGATFAAAHGLTRAWREHKTIKSRIDYEELKKATPQQVFDRCGDFMFDKVGLRNYLKECTDSGTISKEQSAALYRYFSNHAKN